MEKEDNVETASEMPQEKEVNDAGEKKALKTKHFYEQIIAEAEYSFLNASVRLPKGGGGDVDSELKRKVGAANLSKTKAVLPKTGIEANISGHSVERVVEVLSEPISISDHDILADEIVELVSQTLKLSTDQETDIFAPLRAVSVN